MVFLTTFLSEVWRCRNRDILFLDEVVLSRDEKTIHGRAVQVHQEIQDRITKISDNMKQAFEDSTASFIQDTDATTTELNTEIANIAQVKNDEFMNQTDSLNEKQRTTLEAQLEGIAVDLTNETNYTKIHRYGVSINFCPMCGKRLRS